MNDPLLALEKIEALMKASRATENLFEHAAAFGAIATLVKHLEIHFEEVAEWAGKDVEGLRWHSAAMLGYEITNGKDADQHYQWALNATSALRHALVRIKR